MIEDCQILINNVECRKPSIVKYGVRCDNGCFGEGEMEYACEEHKDTVSNHRKTSLGFRCIKCSAHLIVFPIQKVY